MKINLDGVRQTLLIPLWGRAKLSQENNPVPIDSKAGEIVKKIEYNFSKIGRFFPYFLHNNEFSQNKND